MYGMWHRICALVYNGIKRTQLDIENKYHDK